MEETQQEINYCRLVTIQQRAADASSEDLMKLVSARAPDPEVFETYPPLFLQSEISSNRWDAYHTRMMPSTLKNFAAEAAAGVAILRNHSTREDPIGHSLTGQFIQGSGNGVARVLSDFFVSTDPETAPYAAKLRSGVVRDNSVGFYGGEWMCTLCGKDMEQWMVRDGCMHMPGMLYTVKDETGKPEGEPKMARAEIENAHLAEYSTVYDGATPGSMILKARMLAQEGQLNERERDLIQVRYRLVLPDAARVFPGAALTAAPSRPEKNMTPEEEARAAQDNAAAHARMLVTLRGLGMAQDVTDPEAWTRTELQRLRLIEADVKTVCEKDEEPKDALTRLRVQASDGATYREDVIADALAEGVRARGDKFDQAKYKPILERSPLDSIKTMRDDWKAIGDERLSAGRKTADGPDEEKAPAAPLPAGAYG